MRRALRETLRHYAPRESLKTAPGITSLIIMVTAILAVFMLANFIVANQKNDFDINNQRQANNLINFMKDNLVGYEQVLLGGAGLIRIEGDVTRSEWEKFIQSMRVTERFPAILGAGYVEYVPAEQLQAHKERVRAEGFPNYDVTPTNPRDEYTSILYIEPFNEVNQRAFGYDMFSEPRRHAAMVYARDNAELAVSEPVELVQDSRDEIQSSINPGVLMYYPIYDANSTPRSTSRRVAALKGYTYIVFRPADILGNSSDQEQMKQDTFYRVYDLSSEERELLYASSDQDPGHKGLSTYSQSIEVANREWGVDFYSTDPSITNSLGAIAVLVFGTLSSIFLGFAVFAVLTNRAERLQTFHQKELKKTKDELIALTSHQLRTPASGVKQYIGMLKDGFFGNLNEGQAAIAQKAYDVNERQLEIIDEILYVAKADAGQLLVTPEKTDVTKLVMILCENLNNRALKKQIELVCKSRRKIFANIDPKLAQMAVENLITNGIKYSYPGSKVTVRITSTAHEVRISVQDKGVGIAEEDTRGVIKKFHRIDNPLSQSEGGSGLGLFLANQIALAHNGRIDIVSKLGKGSTFTLVLPMLKKKSRKKQVILTK
jgi:signal transduction histidine kinase